MLCGNYLDRSKNKFLSSLSLTICTFCDLVQLLEFLESCNTCMGNSEDKILDVVKHRNSPPKDMFVVFLDAVLSQAKTVLFMRHSLHWLQPSDSRHVMLPTSTGIRCHQFVSHRASLLVQCQRLQTLSKSIHPLSTANLRYLAVPS